MDDSILQPPQYRLADYFNAWWGDYLSSPREPVMPWQLKAVNALKICRTPGMGVDLYACESCGDTKEQLYSCKNRFCPSCSWRDTLKWAEKTSQKMLNIPHKHIVFTIPHELQPLIKSNPDLLYNGLMRSAADTLLQWGEHKFGIRPGLVMVLHTFGEKKNYHVHLHVIMSWGGLTIKTPKTLKTIDIKYIPFEYLRKKFRWLYQQNIIDLYRANKLQCGYKSEPDLKRLFKKLNQTSWNVHIEGTITSPEIVIRYVGRYSKRCCLSERKITNIEGEYISFVYKDYTDRDENNKAREKTLTLHYRDFFPLLLQHVPLPYFRLVRYYGVYARRDIIPDEYFCAVQTPDNQEKPLSGDKQGCTSYRSMYCTHCQCNMVYQYSIINYYQAIQPLNPEGKVIWQRQSLKQKKKTINE